MFLVDEKNKKRWAKLTIFSALVAIWFRLDATPALTAAELYVRYVNPSLVSKTFHDGTVTLITGASDGFGAEIAKQLCTKTSTNLILMARRLEKMEEVRQYCRESSQINSDVKIVLVEADVTKGTEAQTQWIQNALKILGKREVDIAIINAGRGYAGSVDETPEELIRDIMDLNFMGAVSTVKAVLSTYTDSGREKHMVAMSSAAAKLPVPLAAGYSASKAALNAFFDSLRAEQLGIRVTTVCPGPFYSGIRENSRRDNASLNPNAPPQEEEKEGLMAVERAVRLTLAGIIASPSWLFHELWFSPQPILTFTAIGQYIPDLAKYVGKPVGGCGGSTICEAARKKK